MVDKHTKLACRSPLGCGGGGVGVMFMAGVYDTVWRASVSDDPPPPAVEVPKNHPVVFIYDAVLEMLISPARFRILSLRPGPEKIMRLFHDTLSTPRCTMLVYRVSLILSDVTGIVNE